MLLSPEITTRGEPSSLIEWGPRRRTSWLGVAGPAGVETASAQAVLWSPESTTRGEPSSLIERGPRRRTSWPGVAGPAGVEEHGVGTGRFPRNLGRPAAPSRQGLARGSQTPIPQAPGPASGRGERRTQAHGRVLPGEAHAKPGGTVRRESERLIVPTRPGNSPAGTRRREGGAVSRNCWEETWPVRRDRNPCQRNNGR